MSSQHTSTRIQTEDSSFPMPERISAQHQHSMQASAPAATAHADSETDEATKAATMPPALPKQVRAQHQDTSLEMSTAIAATIAKADIEMAATDTFVLPPLPNGASFHSLSPKKRCVSTSTVMTALSTSSDVDDDDSGDFFCLASDHSNATDGTADITARATTPAAKTTLLSSILKDVKDLAFAIAILVVCEIIPVALFENYDWRRPIPYQQLQDGQVILDQELMYPLKPNTVSQKVLTLTSIGLPLFAFFLCSAINLARNCYNRNTGTTITTTMSSIKNDLKASICMLLAAHGISFAITHSLKIFVGRFRPNFYAMCEFSSTTLQCEAESQGYIMNAQHSFPSGHSSESFTGMTILAFFFLGKAMRLRSSNTFRLSMLLSLSPFLVSIAIAASRLHDFMHHPSDVLAGSWIGIGCGILAYHMWYPCPMISNPSVGVPLEEETQMTDTQLTGGGSRKYNLLRRQESEV